MEATNFFVFLLLYLYSFIFVKGFLFGIITSLPVGGSALLIIREVYVKGVSVASSLVRIPLLADWISTIFALFFLHRVGLIVIDHLPFLGNFFSILTKNTNGILALIFFYIGIGVWRESNTIEKTPILNVRLTIKNVANVNFFTIPAAILFVWSKIFSTTLESNSNKILFLVGMIIGGISLWYVTLTITEFRRTRKKEIDLQKTNRRFAYIIFAVASFVFFEECFHLYKSFIS